MRSPARLVTLSLLVAGAFALASLERLAPNPFPMVRAGLGNIMTLVAFATMGIRAGVLVTAGRVLLVAVVWGGLFSPTAVLSAAGGAASLLAMVPLVAAGPRFSLLGVSVAGACAHAAGQLAAAYLVYVRSEAVFGLLPLMGAMALATGVFNALVAGWLGRALERGGGVRGLRDPRRGAPAGWDRTRYGSPEPSTSKGERPDADPPLPR